MQSLHAVVGRAVPRPVRSLSLIAILVLSACTPAPGATSPTAAPAGAAAPPAASTAAPSQVVLADFAEPALLNPALSTESPRVSRLIFDALVQPDAKLGTPAGSLAEKWELSADGLTYTFHLRPNLKWSDGQPLTAEDAKFTFDLIRDPKNASPFKSNFALVSSIDAPDPLTLKVALTAPSCPFL